jgi:hypothetical protein
LRKPYYLPELKCWMRPSLLITFQPRFKKPLDLWSKFLKTPVTHRKIPTIGRNFGQRTDSPLSCLWDCLEGPRDPLLGEGVSGFSSLLACPAGIHHFLDQRLIFPLPTRVAFVPHSDSADGPFLVKNGGFFNATGISLLDNRIAKI